MSALTGPAKAVRAAVRDATATPRARRARSRRQARVTAPVSPERRSRERLRVEVHASDRVRSGLASQWLITDEDPDAVLVEVDARSSVTVAAPFGRQRAAVAGVEVPVIVWVTSSARVVADDVARLVEGVTAPVHIHVDDAASIPEWAAALGRAVRHLAPAVDHTVHAPSLVGATEAREQVVALVGDAEVDLDRLAPVQPQRLDVIGGDDAASELPGDRPVLGRYRAAALVADRPVAPWHVLEAAAAGTAVVATGATIDRLPEALAEHICRVEDDTQLALQVRAHLWQDELVDRVGLPAARAVRGGHTFAHRAADLEALVGRPRDLRQATGAPFDRSVSAVISTNRAHELDTVADNMARQSLRESGELQVVLVLHGLDVDVADVEARFRERGIDQLVVVPADSSLTLGACLNLGIDASDGAHVAKIDDDNFYGRHYLLDLVDALDYSGAGIAGKWAHYTWLRSTGAVILRFPRSEHRFERLVQGGSILMQGEVARRLRFSDLPRAVDTDLLNRAQAAGVRTYSSDRFNYVSIRGTDRHAHTWTLEDASFMNASSRVVFYGDPREHVDV
ncbi:glycosyltransferase family protein [Janibacter indicus]|uniref:Glycosyl transferases group 1 n=1 Tax=Janibacter indicus TaxID=857417 RepID=A0A1W1ZBZ3_9MICO|nr:glycosyltransferase [Janibacter indicus]SMC45907.1 Glycosyl transferases group 1 [Janibacter indicus]